MVEFVCPIDLLAFTTDDVVVATPCGHIFHHDCVMQWLNENVVCPVCRASTSPSQLLRLFINISDEQLRGIASLRRREECHEILNDASEHSQLEEVGLLLCQQADSHEQEQRALQDAIHYLEIKYVERSSELEQREIQLCQLSENVARSEKKMTVKEKEVQGAEAIIKKKTKALNKAEEEAAVNKFKLTDAKKKIASLEAELKREKGEKEKANKVIQKLNASLIESEKKNLIYRNQMKEADQMERNSQTSKKKKLKAQLRETQKNFLDVNKDLAAAQRDLESSKRQARALLDDLEKARFDIATSERKLKCLEDERALRECLHSETQKIVEDMVKQNDYLRQLASRSHDFCMRPGDESHLIQTIPNRQAPIPPPRERMSIADPQTTSSNSPFSQG